MIAKGKNASELFPAVVKNVASKNIEVLFAFIVFITPVCKPTTSYFKFNIFKFFGFLLGKMPEILNIGEVQQQVGLKLALDSWWKMRETELKL